MNGLTLSVPTEEVRRRISQRLGASESPTGANVVWEKEGRRVLLLVDQLNVRTVGGWLLCDLRAQTDQTGMCTLQFVFFLGRPGHGDGTRAAATINAPTLGGAQIADRFGADLQRVLWDAVLDALEVCVKQVRDQHAGQAVNLVGFRCDGSSVQVDVVVGGR